MVKLRSCAECHVAKENPAGREAFHGSPWHIVAIGDMAVNALIDRGFGVDRATCDVSGAFRTSEAIHAERRPERFELPLIDQTQEGLQRKLLCCLAHHGDMGEV